MTPLPRTAGRAFSAGGLLLLASAAVLWALDTPTVAYVATALLHVGVGIVWTVLLGWVLVRERAAIAPWLWWPAVLAWTASTVAAALLIARGALTSQRPVLLRARPRGHRRLSAPAGGDPPLGRGPGRPHGLGGRGASSSSSEERPPPATAPGTGSGPPPRRSS